MQYKKSAILCIGTLLLGMSISAASTAKLYLWHKGVVTTTTLADVVFNAAKGLIGIENEDFPISEIDSMTLKTPATQGTPSTILNLSQTSAHDMTVKVLAAHSYRMVTTGDDPYILTTSIKKALPADSSILVFEYRVDKRIDHLKVFFADPISENRSEDVGSLEATTLWKTARFDINDQRVDLEWGKVGNYLRLDPGSETGITLEMRNIHFASPTAEELVAREKALHAKTYIDNGTVRLGVDMERGGSVFYFALSSNQTNLLNHSDEGRFIQQSYYGERDGSTWNGQSWSWNPIQGGGCNGTKAQLRSYEVTDTTLDVVSIPVHWAYSTLMPELEMEEKISLDGNIGHIHYIFRNNGNGATDHPNTTHEMPAVFIDAAYQHLKFYYGEKKWQNEALMDTIPGWPNEAFTRSEEWSAYVNDKGYGIGVYTPGTPEITAYRYGSGANTGPKGSDCSYFAPVRRFAITKGMTVEYDVYVTIGDIQDIRARFYDIHDQIEPNWREEAENDYLQLGDNGIHALTCEKTEDNTFHIETTDGDPYVYTSKLTHSLESDQSTLTFEYKSNQSIPFEVFFSPIVGGRSMTFSLTASSDWKKKEIDITSQRKTFSWGAWGDYMRFDVGAGSGIKFDIRNISIK